MDSVAAPAPVLGAPAYTQPWALLNVRLDGRPTDYLEWIAAGHYDAARESAAAGRPRASWLRDVYFGFDKKNFLLRIDLPRDMNRHEILRDASLTVVFDRPSSRRLELVSLATRPYYTMTGPAGVAGYEVLGTLAADSILELSCPLQALGLRPGETSAFHIEVCHGAERIEALPLAGPIAIRIPGADTDRIRWEV